MYIQPNEKKKKFEREERVEDLCQRETKGMFVGAIGTVGYVFFSIRVLFFFNFLNFFNFFKFFKFF